MTAAPPEAARLTLVALTCDSYGRVDGDGAALDPDSYDYRRAARDAIHFPARGV